MQPGERWGDEMTWTPETMFFALAWATDGQTAKAEELVAWMDAHRTPVGAYPEKVGPDGHPAAVSTLGWTASLTVLTLASLEDPMDPPPAEVGVGAAAPGPRRADAAWAVTGLLVLAVGAVAALGARGRRGSRAGAPTLRRA